MPGLRFYGRKWQFGADDVTVPSCLCSLSRITWVVLLSIFYVATIHASLECSQNVRLYTSFALGVYSVTFLIYVSMLIVSCRGTVLEVEKRWCMPGLFKLLTLFILFETSMTIYGTYLSTGIDDPCEDDTNVPYIAMRAVVVGSWVDIFFATCCGCLGLSLSTADDTAEKQRTGTINSKNGTEAQRCCYFWGDVGDSSTTLHHPLVSQTIPSDQQDASDVPSVDVDDEAQDFYRFDSDEERDSDSRYNRNVGDSNGMMDDADYEEDMGKTTRTWNTRCRRLCTCFQCFTCGVFGGMNGTGGPDAFQQVAVVLAGWFKNLDLVPSDIVAALFLMRAEQIQMEASAVEALLRERQENRRDRSIRRNLTHVGRWMWMNHGPNERANLRLHAQQIRESRDARRPRLSSSGSDGESNPFVLDPEARDLLLFAADMAPFMLGMYGWLLYSYMTGVRGWLTLIVNSGRRRCCCCRRPQYRDEEVTHDEANSQAAWQFLSPASPSSNGGGPRRLMVLDDGCFEFNTAALLQRVGRQSAAKADVVYASFATFGGQAIPYSVCVDHAKRRVVVAVRGLFTVSDALTNVTMVPTPLASYAARWGFQDEIDADSHAHAGILRVAEWMRSDLQRQDILHRLFGISARDGDDTPNGDPSVRRDRSFSMDPRALPDCRGYGLELTGHSLGAGVAVVLSLFLRPVFPNVRCMAFSPPGCVFDWKLSNRCSSWVYCVFVGKDFAPRMSWHSLFTLRGQVLDTLRRDKANKFGAILSAIAGRPIDRLLYKSDEVPDSVHAREMERKIDELANRRSTALDAIRLYAPGKLLHLMKDETVRRNCCSFEKHYVPMWIDNRSALDEILLSTRMAFDHFPDVVDNVLRGVVHEYCT